MSTWTFVYMMVILKIPIALLLYLVWWAVRQVPDEWAEQPADGDGGSRRKRDPRGGRPRGPRRGPHGSPAPTPPPRVRTVVARGKRAEQR